MRINHDDRRRYIKRRGEGDYTYHDPMQIILREQLLQPDKTELDSRLHQSLTNSINWTSHLVPLRFSFCTGKIGMGTATRGLCDDFKRNIYFKVWLDQQLLKTISNKQVPIWSFISFTQNILVIHEAYSILLGVTGKMERKVPPQS